VSSTGALEACSWLSSQVTARRKPRQPLLLLIDGDHRLWDTANEHLPADRIEILDIVHVSAYIWEAAGILCSQERARESFTRTRLRLILQGRVKSVIRGLRHLATAGNLRGDAAQRIATIANYLDAHAERMRYHRYLAAGYPIATGVIEGACRHVVKDRMERTGMRWTLVAAKAMLNLRAVSASGHWDDFHTTRTTKRNRAISPTSGRAQGRSAYPVLMTALSKVRLHPSCCGGGDCSVAAAFDGAVGGSAAGEFCGESSMNLSRREPKSSRLRRALSAASCSNFSCSSVIVACCVLTMASNCLIRSWQAARLVGRGA
jgi:hypothetical protein